MKQLALPFIYIFLLGCSIACAPHARTVPSPAFKPFIAIERELSPLLQSGAIGWGDWVGASVREMDYILTSDPKGAPAFIESILDGKMSQEERFAMMMGGSEYLFPDATGLMPATRYASNPSLNAWARKIRSLELLSAATEVRVFTKNPAAVEDYYHFLLWSRKYLSVPDVSFTGFRLDDFFGANASEWQTLIHLNRAKDAQVQMWYLRDFILLAHATGRDDLFAGVTDPHRLIENAHKWDLWSRGMPDVTFGHMVADPETRTLKMAKELHPDIDDRRIGIPSAPLPHWHGPVPPSYMYIFYQYEEPIVEGKHKSDN